MQTFSYQEKELEKELARREHVEFIRYCWTKNHDTNPFMIGLHTNKICEFLDKAIERFRNKKSTFGIIKCPPQHGKSDTISRYFPPRFMGEFPDKEMVVVSHTLKKAHKFSRFGRNLIRDSKKYKELYNVVLSRDSQSVDSWEIANNSGVVNWFGIQSGVAGDGADCMIIDDYVRNREEAESAVIREKIWNEFTDGLITRRHEPCIFIILATQWNVDDLIGRYEQKMGESRAFPPAEIISLPAQSEEYEKGYLFPEMYSSEFYEQQKIILGKYGWMSLYQQTPTLKGGNLFNTESINIIDIFAESVYKYEGN